MTDHIMMVKESTRGTFVTPSVAYALVDFTHSAGVTRIEQRQTGNTRGIHESAMGSFKGTFSATLLIHAKEVGQIIKASCFNSVTKSTPGGATNARQHAFLQADSATLTSMSIQTQVIKNGTTVTHNLRGCVVDSLTITVASDQFATMKIDGFMYEIALAGATFDDGNSSPIAATPTYGTATAAFTFADSQVTYGGTVSKDGTSKLYSISGATTLTRVESWEVKISNGLDPKIFLDSNYVQDIIRGPREITFSVVVNTETPVSTWFTKGLANTQDAWQFTVNGSVIESSTQNALRVVLPLVSYTDAPTEAMSGEAGSRSLTIAGKALVWDTSDEDCTIILTDDNDTGY